MELKGVVPAQGAFRALPGESAPIRDTKLNRFLTLSAIRLLRRFRPRLGRVNFLTPKVCMKHGTHLSEAAAMRYIATHTSIPVPKVYCTFKRRGLTYIVMRVIQGEWIGSRWLERSEVSKRQILDQLRDMIIEMRALQPPENCGVSSVDGGQLFDERLPGGQGLGPFSTVEDFHHWLRAGVEQPIDRWPEVGVLIDEHRKTSHQVNFTHGDLSSLNIIVEGDKVSGIIDSEMAGWLPYYWEYTTACNVNPRDRLWAEEIDKFLQAFPRELAMDKLRDKYFGDIPHFS